MSCFAARLIRSGGSWALEEVSLDGCESVADLADLLRDVEADVRLVVIEQDDEYAAVVRLDGDSEDDEPRAFLSDAHAADSYAVAGYVAEDLDRVGSSVDDHDVADLEPDDDLGAVGVTHESVPLGDAAIVEDLGTPAGELLALCAHEGTLPVDVLAAICERAGCGPEFDELRG